MTRLIAAEWLKTISTKMWWILFIVAAALTLLSSLPLLLLSGTVDPDTGEPLLSGAFTDPETVRSLFSTMGSATVIALVLGILAFTGEYRHQTITDTFLTEPRRLHVVAAKSVVAALFGALLAALTSAVALIAIFAVLSSREHAPIDWGHVAITFGAVMIAYALYAVLGVGFGALVTNQIAAIVIALLWVLLIESLIVALKPQIGEWLPGGAAAAVLSTPDSELAAQLLPPWAGVLVLLGYAALFGVLASATTLRRDIT